MAKTNKIRLIYVMQEYSPDVGGWATPLFTELSKHIDITVLALPYQHSIAPSSRIEVISPSFRIIRYKARIFKGVVFPDNKDFVKILDGALAINKVSLTTKLICHMDEYFKPYSLITMMWCQNNNIPYVISSRMRRRPGILKNFMLWYFKQLAYNGVMKAKKIISTQGKCSQMEFLRWFPSISTDMFENIPSGIKIKKVLEDKTKENRNIILAVSRIYPIKRIDLLLRVFSDVVKYTDAELWIIGKEEKEEFIKLQNLLKELVKLNPRLIDKRGKMRIKFFGGIENKNLSEFYSKAKLLVNTSETEGICFSFLEAMLHKLPIVAWDVGGNNGVVDNGVTGYLHEFGDIERMSLSIQRLLSNTEKHKITRKAMGYAAFNKLKNNFDIKKNVNKYLEVYQSILGPINFD